jgi:hypothetical protein
MKKGIKLLAFFFATISLFSCEKVIQIDFKDSDARIVIEGELTDDASQPQTITISKSTDFQTTNDQLFVSGAVVLISDDQGNSVQLTETSPGKYQTSNLPGIYGRTYNLSVTYDGKEYTSSCTMPQKTTLDSLSVLKSPGFGPIPPSIGIVPNFLDIAGIRNYYRVKMFINGEFASSFMYDDEYGDGIYNHQPLQSFDKEIRPLDTVLIQMMNIDKNVFTYFNNLTGDGFDNSATPANPKSNISGGALGYFSAYANQKMSIVVY